MLDLVGGFDSARLDEGGVLESLVRAPEAVGEVIGDLLFLLRIHREFVDDPGEVLEVLAGEFWNGGSHCGGVVGLVRPGKRECGGGVRSICHGRG